MFMELHREEKSEEGDTGDQEDKGGNQKERDRSSQSGTHKEFSIVQYTQRDSQSWVERRRGREEIEVTWWRKGRVQRGREQSSQ